MAAGFLADVDVGLWPRCFAASQLSAGSYYGFLRSGDSDVTGLVRLTRRL
jgi:hypothetical protein